MNFHENKLWQDAYVALMDIYTTLDEVDPEVRDSEEETIESLLLASQNVAAKISDGLSRLDKRIGKGLLYDAIGLVAIARTHIAIAWGRGILTDDTLKALDAKYQSLSQSLQSIK